CNLHSQITLQIYVVEKINSKGLFVLDFTLKNTTSENIVIPIDTTKFRNYWASECDFSEWDLQKYPYLAMSVKFRDIKTGRDEFVNGGNISLDLSNPLELKADKRRPNQYVYNHLIFLKPQEIIRFRKKMDITYYEYEEFFPSFEYAFLQDNTDYEFSFVYCSECAGTYNLLTNEEKEKIKNYKFFNGVLESNKILFHYRSH